MRKFNRFIRDKRVVYAACGVLCVLLLALIVCERRDPEAGTELIRGLISSVRG